MATIARLVTVIEAQTQGFDKVQTTLTGMEQGVNTLGSSLKTMAGSMAAAFSVQAIAAAGRQALQTASQIQDAAEQIGISAESVQRLSFAAQQGGSSLETVATAMGQMASILGGPGGEKALAAVGMTFADIQGLAPDQTFIAIADAIAKIPDPLKQADAARDLFGRGALDLLPAIKAGFEAVGAAAPVMSNAIIGSADTSGDKLQALQLRMNNLKAQALLPLIDAFTQLPGPLQTAGAAVMTFAPSLQTLAMGIMAAGGPVAAFAGLKTGVLALVPLFTTAIPTAAAFIVTLFTVTLPAAFTAILPFLGPIGLIAAAVGAVFLVWKNWDAIAGIASGVYTAVKDWLVDKFAPVVTDIKAALIAVGKAFFDMHVKVAEIVALMYTAIKDWLFDKFMEVVGKIKGAIDMVTGYFKSMYDKVVGQSYVPEMIEGITAAFGQLDAVMVSPAEKAARAVAEAFARLAENHKDSQKTMLSTTEATVASISGVMGAFGAKNKKFAIAEAVTATALAAVRALAFPPGPPFSLIYVAAAIAAGAIQIAKIKSQDTSFATGTHGKFVDFGAGTPAMLHGKERVVTEAEGRAEAGNIGALTAEVRGLRRDLLRQQTLLPLIVRDHMLLASV